MNVSPASAGLNACVNLGRLEEAAALLGEMQRAGCPPDVRTHNILLKAASREGAWAQVSRVHLVAASWLHTCVDHHSQAPQPVPFLSSAQALWR